MKNKMFLILGLLLILAFQNNVFAEEITNDVKADQEEKDKDLRKVYKNTYKGMIILSKAIHNEEGALRLNHLGIGISGNILFRIQSWQSTPLRDGFIDLDLNYVIRPHLNLAVSSGYHKTDSSQVVPVCGMLQWVGGSDEIGMVPSSVGLEIGAISYFSNVSEESMTSFRIGICRYDFFTKNLALTGNIDFITPSFRDNNFDIKIGIIYYL